MNVDERLALLRIHQWRADKDRIRRGTLTLYRHRGWTPYDACQADARIVRVMDFERVLSKLPAHQQTILMLVHRDGHSATSAAREIRWPASAIQYHLTAARRALAQALDRECLL